MLGHWRNKKRAYCYLDGHAWYVAYYQDTVAPDGTWVQQGLIHMQCRRCPKKQIVWHPMKQPDLVRD